MIHNISRFIAALALLATAQGAWADTETVSYIDADGNEQTVTATVLTGNEEPSKWGAIDLAAGWYVVKGNISYTNLISYASYSTGTIHIILADGAQMSVEYNGKAAISLSKYHPLAIYGQSAGTGRFSVTSDCNAIAATGGITINGGIVSATSTGGGRSAIDAHNEAITINGGQVTATPGDNSKGITTAGTITLGLRSASDFITANGYYGTVNIKDGQALKTPSGNIYYGTLTDAQKSAIANVTLQPATQAEFIAAALPQTAADTYTISDATGWNVFCDALQDNDTYNRFSGKTVQLDADITVSRMAGSSKHDFCGTFDGGGHTLTFNHGTSDSYASDEYTAPFCYVSTVTPSGGSEVPTNFRNLHVSGDIYTTAKFAAGLIARQWGTVYVENCRSSIVVHSNVTNDQNGGNDGTHGGFVSVQQDGTLSFTGCTFDGKLLTNANNATTRCGGFVGYLSSGTTNITNCLYAPAALADGETEVVDGNSATFVRNGAPTVTNSYYTRALGTAQGKATRTVAAADDVTIEAVALTGTATQYTVSGITAYSGGGLQRGQTLYYGSGDQLSLTLSNTATPAPRGYQYGYTASAGTLSGTTLTMPDQDVTISVNTADLAPIDWATVNQGTSKDPYMIYNKDQLLLLAHRVNGTSGGTTNTYQGKYFKLGADITFTHPDNETEEYAENYEAIGGYYNGTNRYFNGTFDGDNHTVSGIRIRKEGSGNAYDSQGLFGLIGNGANIHDVHLTDARIKGYNRIGGIVGGMNVALNGSGVTVSGCSVTDSYITATSSSYGIICGSNTTGYSDGTLANNYYHGCTVNGTAITSGKGCGSGNDIYGFSIADIADNNGALPAYAIALGANITTPPGTFAGQTGWLDTPPVSPRLAPENGFTLAGNHYFVSGYEFTPGSTLASGAAQGYTPRATLGGQLLDPYTPTGNDAPLAGTAIARLTVTADCDGKTLASTEAIYSTRQPVTVAYIKADGTTQTAQAVALDGTETTLAAGTYFAGLENVNFDHTVNLTGNVTLILCDGCEMKVGTSGSRINDYGIRGNSYTLDIYAQSLGSGALSVYTTGGSNSAISVKALTVNGGNVIANTDGMASKGIYSNSDITINGGSVTAYCTGTSSNGIYANGSAKVTINGGTVNATAKNYGVKGTITRGWTKPADRISITASSYSGTVAVADGKKLHNGSSFLGGTLGDPAADVNGKTLRPAATATYTTADGTADTADAILLDASDNSLPAGNYLATGTLNYTHGITLTGDVTLILADNCHMNIGMSGEGRFNGYGIDGYDSNTDTMYDLTITSEANGSGNGALSVYTKGTGNDAIFASELTINGGNITADTEGNGALALIAGHGIVTINGGTVSANATGSDADAIYASWKFNYSGGNVSANATQYAICAGGGNGTITLTWADAATDRITASSYSGTVTLARLFTDAAAPADNYYGGTYTGDALNALAGKTLSGTTEVALTEDNATQALAAINGMSGIGVTFNRAFTARKPSTICLPFDYTKNEGDGSFYAFTSIEHSGSEYIATMTEPGTTTLTANTPYLYLPSATGNVEFSGMPTTAIAAGTTTSDDWTFQGTYDEVKWDTAPTGIYGFSAQDVSDQSISQGEFVKVGAKVRIRPLRAYLKYKNGTENYSAAPTRGTTAELPDRIIVHLIGSDGNTTAIGTLDTRTGEVEIDTWYDLNGRKLSAKPTHRGIYINNGRKVVIK